MIRKKIPSDRGWIPGPSDLVAQCHPRPHSKERDKENNPPIGNDVGIESEVSGGEMFDREYEGGPKRSRPNNERKTTYNFKIIFIFQHDLPLD